MHSSNTAPLTPTAQDWYDHLRIEPPPAIRGVHHLGPVSPTHVRFAVVAGDGRIILDGIREVPIDPLDMAHLECLLDRKDPPPPRLALVR